MGKGALCSFLDCKDIKYKIAQSKGAVDKMLSHFITAPFFGILGCYPPRRRSLLWWTLAPMTPLDRHRRQRPRRTRTPPPPLSRVNKRLTSQAVPDCPSPFPRFSFRQVSPLTYHQCPPFLRHSVIPPHRPPPHTSRYKQRVSAGLGGQLRRPRRQRHL